MVTCTEFFFPFNDGEKKAKDRGKFIFLLNQTMNRINIGNISFLIVLLKYIQKVLKSNL